MIHVHSCMEMNSSNPGRGNSPVTMYLRPVITVVIGMCLLAGCTLLPEPQTVAVNKYVLEYNPVAAASGDTSKLPVVIITVPRAHGGYNTSRIAYRKQHFGLQYYAKSRWADTPARMLAPLVAEAVSDTGEFQGLYASPGALSARYRLDSELIHFHQDFTVQPSEVHITLRAQLVGLDNNRVIASRLIDIREAADSEDAYGGVQAANRASTRLLGELAQFCRAGTGR